MVDSRVLRGIRCSWMTRSVEFVVLYHHTAHPEGVSVDHLVIRSGPMSVDIVQQEV